MAGVMAAAAGTITVGTTATIGAATIRVAGAATGAKAELAALLRRGGPALKREFYEPK